MLLAPVVVIYTRWQPPPPRPAPLFGPKNLSAHQTTALCTKLKLPAVQKESAFTKTCLTRVMHTYKGTVWVHVRNMLVVIIAHWFFFQNSKYICSPSIFFLISNFLVECILLYSTPINQRPNFLQIIAALDKQHHQMMNSFGFWGGGAKYWHAWAPAMSHVWICTSKHSCNNFETTDQLCFYIGLLFL